MSDELSPPPPGELKGLRAFEVQVGAYAGQRYAERPLWVEIEGQRSDVDMIVNQWREDDRIGFLVALRDGRRVLLSYVPTDDLWAGIVLV